MLSEPEKIIDIKKIAELVGMTPNAIRVRRCRNTLPFATFRGANTALYARLNDVLEYRRRMEAGEYEHKKRGTRTPPSMGKGRKKTVAVEGGAK